MENFYSFFLNYDYTIRSDQIEAEAEPSGNVEGKLPRDFSTFDPKKGADESVQLRGILPSINVIC